MAQKFNAFNKRWFKWTFGVLGALITILFLSFWYDSLPVTRDEAVAVSGTFERYEDEDAIIYLITDGEQEGYWVDLSCVTYDLALQMSSVKRGDTVDLLLHPTGEWVLEVCSDGKELLAFDESVEKLAADGKDYLIMAIVLAALWLLLIAYFVLRSCHFKRKESEEPRLNVDPLGPADMEVKARTLLRAKVGSYDIWYRRVKLTNELVVNGYLYDSYKALVEFEHTLRAEVGGHVIEAGMDADSCSFIWFDKTLIEMKQRIL